ncbi:MAG: PqqD family protein [Ignavibacteriaceae bacterium]|nr:PqqD family protein [Ignavibacterium sp.]MCC6253906.1 PqqD family protein [Ignavibacteriaceae bacterium]HRN25609.1 PqqD family protein [Ignavibacteriaceae bacterium]HRP93347.1 PqqD family protein [Ignavibacteriaceae bacterium]
MPLTIKEQKKILESTNALDLTPTKIYSDEKDESGLITILIPKFKNTLLKKYIAPKLKDDNFRVKLDKFGSAVWFKIDDESNVYQIIKDIKAKFGDELQEETERIAKFIFQLYHKGFITFKELN